MPFTPVTATYFIGVAGFSGTFVSLMTVANLSRRTILIGGHAIMMIFLSLVGLFTDFN